MSREFDSDVKLDTSFECREIETESLGDASDRY
jgi:hypothetical protein